MPLIQGAAFDLEVDTANKLLEKAEELTSRGFTLDVPKSLPLEEERGGWGNRGNDRGYGRNNNYGGGSRFNNNNRGYNR